eukprot:SAG31_NODE_90_length_26410_cov_175.663981_13_plen_69_part_00
MNATATIRMHRARARTQRHTLPHSVSSNLDHSLACFFNFVFLSALLDSLGSASLWVGVGTVARGEPNQ